MHASKSDLRYRTIEPPIEDSSVGSKSPNISRIDQSDIYLSNSYENIKTEISNPERPTQKKSLQSQQQDRVKPARSFIQDFSQ